MAERPIIPYEAVFGALLVGLWLVVALIGLGSRPAPRFDEVYHAKAAAELSVGKPPSSEVTHPPLLKDVAAAALLLSGTAFDPGPKRWVASQPSGVPPAAVWWWRLPSVFAGAAALVVVGLLARVLLGPGPAAVGAMALLALDGCFFVHARLAMTNVWEVLFVVIAALGAWKAAGDEPGPDGWLALAGAACGAAVACRWSALAPFVLLAGWLAWRLRHAPKRWLPLAAAFTAMPALVYAATYAPLVAIQPLPGAWDLLSPAAWKAGFVDAQLTIFEYHSLLRDVHPHQSPWWSWPLMVRPVWYAIDWTQRDVYAIWAIGNAFVWWASAPALVGAAIAGRRRPALGFVALLGLGCWLAWAFQPRAMTFMHYYLPAVTFACIALAALGQAWWRGRALAGGPGPLDATAARALVAFYLVAVVGWFAFYYPMLANAPLSRPQAMQRIWFGPAWM